MELAKGYMTEDIEDKLRHSRSIVFADRQTGKSTALAKYIIEVSEGMVALGQSPYLYVVIPREDLGFHFRELYLTLHYALRSRTPIPKIVSPRYFKGEPLGKDAQIFLEEYQMFTEEQKRLLHPYREYIHGGVSSFPALLAVPIECI